MRCKLSGKVLEFGSRKRDDGSSYHYVSIYSGHDLIKLYSDSMQLVAGLQTDKVSVFDVDCYVKDGRMVCRYVKE